MIYFLIVYIIYLIGFSVFSAVGIYHLNRFGYVGDLTKPAIITYIILANLVIVTSLILILTHSWPVDFQVGFIPLTADGTLPGVG